MNLNLALDDVIAKNKSTARQDPVARADHRERRSGRDHRKRNEIPRGDPTSAWTHDLYREEQEAKTEQEKADSMTLDEHVAEKAPLERPNTQTTDDAMDEDDAAAAQIKESYGAVVEATPEVEPSVPAPQPAQKKGREMLVVSNLHYEVDEPELSAIFAACPGFVRCAIQFDEAGRSSGDGKVFFETFDDAKKAELDMAGKELNGQQITLRYERPAPPARFGSRAAAGYGQARTRGAFGRGNDRDRNGGYRTDENHRPTSFRDRRNDDPKVHIRDRLTYNSGRLSANNARGPPYRSQQRDKSRSPPAYNSRRSDHHGRDARPAYRPQERTFDRRREEGGDRKFANERSRPY